MVRSNLPEATAAGSEAKQQWVQRVLGVDPGSRQGGGAQPAAATGTVQFSKLILGWRAAERTAIDNLVALGDSVLAHPDVKDTETAKRVEQVIPELRGLIPQFGDELRDAVDDIYNADTEEKKAAARATARQAIAAYRVRLQSEPRLPALERFGKEKLGRGELHSPLFGILDDIDHAIVA